MPGRDRSGPMGAGPRTGHGMGYCGGYDQPGFTYQAGSFQGGFSSKQAGMGHGWRYQFYATGLPGWARTRSTSLTHEQELNWLKNEAEWLKNQLETLNRRIKELETKPQ